ncbi:hypothetical protein ElyMa_005944900 [Elysia marginata]|uniref:Uncharacterized protein n=1 Tax=Elysia marginata TaxID=1093978 RepID=A0AAV4GC09_9GAST|nr:hypothetical protein ElyMa_005944900 [Elysia marginata]
MAVLMMPRPLITSETERPSPVTVCTVASKPACLLRRAHTRGWGWWVVSTPGPYACGSKEPDGIGDSGDIHCGAAANAQAMAEVNNDWFG